MQETVFRHTRDVNRDASFQNRDKFGELKEEARRALADYVGASPAEIAIAVMAELTERLRRPATRPGQARTEEAA